jgi:hypothetical protein
MEGPRRALDDGDQLVNRLLGAPFGELGGGRGDPHLGPAARLRRHAGERGPHRGGLPQLDLRAQLATAQVEHQRVLAPERALHPLRRPKRRQGIVEPSLPETHQPSALVDEQLDLGGPAGSQRALRPVHTALGLCEPSEPRERGAGGGE